MSCRECAHMRKALAGTDEQLEDALDRLRALDAEVSRLQETVEELMLEQSRSADAYCTKIRALEAELDRLRKRGVERAVDPEGKLSAFPGRGRVRGAGPWKRKGT